MIPQSFYLIHCPVEGTNLIETSAGTGKSYTICNLYARLIIEKEEREEWEERGRLWFYAFLQSIHWNFPARNKNFQIKA